MDTFSVSWEAEPLGRTNQRLQHLNARGGIAIVVAHEDTSPIQEARRVVLPNGSRTFVTVASFMRQAALWRGQRPQ